MNLNKISIVSLLNSLLVSSLLVVSLGCSGGGGSSGGDEEETIQVVQKSFPAVVDGTRVVFGSASFDSVLEDDMPVSSLATVSLVDKKIMIEDAQGVRSYQITLKFSDDKFSNVTSESGDFISTTPAKSKGTLATLKWDGSSKVFLESVILTDANGGNIAAMVK